MAVTFGFYNAVDGDRKYNATHFGSLFEGIIRDGVFFSVAQGLRVSDTTGGMTVTVHEGRAWFDKTWTNNDTLLVLNIEEADVLYGRIDAVILEVDSSDEVRANSIKILKGTPAEDPQRPVLTFVHGGTLKQHPLAYISVPVGLTTVTQAEIESVIGTEDCPWVTGPLETIDATELFSQWEAQFSQWFQATKDETDDQEALWASQFDLWFLGIMNSSTEDLANWQAQFDNWYASITGNYQSIVDGWTYDFETWFSNLQAQLDTNVAANLQNQIDAMRKPLTADRNYYVRTDGSDANTGLINTSGGAFLTVQKAIDVATAFDLKTNNVAINIANGTYTGAVTLKPFLGSGLIRLRGNLTTPSSVTFSMEYGNCISSLDGGSGHYEIEGIRFLSTNGSALGIAGAYRIGINDVEFGNCASHHILLNKGAVLFINPPGYHITGECSCHWGVYTKSELYLGSGGSIYIHVITNPTNMGMWINARYAGIADFTNNTVTYYNKAYITGAQYLVQANALILTNGQDPAGFFPGTTPGASDTGGQFI